MCNPLALVMAGLSIAGGVANYAGQASAASQQAKYQNDLALARAQQINENNLISQQNYNNQMQQENLRQQELAAQANQEKDQSGLDALRKSSTAFTSAGEAGVSGLSIDSLVSDYWVQDAYNRTNIDTNLGWKIDQSEMNKQSYRANAMGNVASIRPYVPEPVRYPSFLASAINIAGDAIGSYSRVRAGQQGYFNNTQQLSP